MEVSDEKNEAAFTKSSMSVPELNNFVVSMRSSVKKAKQQVIQKLLRKVKLYKNKKGSEEQVTANNKKADRLLDEIRILKKVDVDKVSKFSLGNQLSVDQAAAKGSLNERVYTRVACHKSVHDNITSWRQQHDDWESLAAFALSKTTGRRYKKKKHTTDGTTEDAGNVEVAKLKEFVERVSGKAEEEEDSDNEAAHKSDTDAAAGEHLISQSVGIMKTNVSASDQNSTNSIMNKPSSSEMAIATPMTTSCRKDEQDKQPQLKSVKLKKKADVVVKQITLDQLCDEELFLPPLNDSENSELEEGAFTVSTEPQAENNFFADGSESSDAELSVQEMEYESGDEQEDEDGSTTAMPVSNSAKLIERSQYNKVPKAYVSRSFGPRRDGGNKSYPDRTERFVNKNFTKSRGHFPNMRGDSYPKKFGKKLQGKFGEQESGYLRKQRDGDKTGKFTSKTSYGNQLQKRTYKPGPEMSKKQQVPAPSQKPQADEHLHPSWEASRRKKEQQKNLFAFQGTKKVFNDDD